MSESEIPVSEPSTSDEQKHVVRPPILVQKKINGPLGEEYTKPLRAGPFRAKYPQKKHKKSISFAEDSGESEESDVTILRPQMSRSHISSSSTRFFVASDGIEEDCHVEISFEGSSIKFTNSGRPRSYCEAWRCLRRNRLCKIVICLLVGVVFPSCLVITVLFVKSI